MPAFLAGTGAQVLRLHSACSGEAFSAFLVLQNNFTLVPHLLGQRYPSVSSAPW